MSSENFYLLNVMWVIRVLYTQQSQQCLRSEVIFIVRFWCLSYRSNCALSLFLFVSVNDECLFLQWPESECETARLRELMRFHDHHHGAFKKYVSENKPKLWKQTAHLLSYAGFLRYVIIIILPARSAVCYLYWSNYFEHTQLNFILQFSTQ